MRYMGCPIYVSVWAVHIRPYTYGLPIYVWAVPYTYGLPIYVHIHMGCPYTYGLSHILPIDFEHAFPSALQVPCKVKLKSSCSSGQLYYCSGTVIPCDWLWRFRKASCSLLKCQSDMFRRVTCFPAHMTIARTIGMRPSVSPGLLSVICRVPTNAFWNLTPHTYP